MNRETAHWPEVTVGVREVDTADVRRTFELPQWNEEIRERIVTYWAKRGVVFSETSGRRLHGRRGGLLGNLTSLDMSKLRTEVTITITASNQCICELKVSTAFQIITKWNAAYWQLELGTFESAILRSDNKEQEWAGYLRMARRADILLTVLILAGPLFLVAWWFSLRVIRLLIHP